MKQTLLLTALSALLSLEQAALPRHDYPVQPVPFTAVHLADVFWAPRIETNRQVSIPFAFQQCELSGRVDNFERAARVLRGETLTNTRPPGYPFDDTDLYKVIEGASYVLSVRPDPKLDAYVDGMIAKIAAAQEPDGYLYTTRTINPQNPHRWAGKERWELERDDSHELYNLGHLYEAAVAHHQATGKRTLLDVAIRTADLLVETFGPGKNAIWESVVGKKLYITGGIGASGRGEAFGGEYELPNMTAYNETCAAIGNDYWNHRLFLLHGDAKYIDVMERTLYNGLLSGVSLDGKSFFYPNPLESKGQHQRSPWFGVACCPGNITRFMASFPGYMYAQKAGTIY